VVVGLFLLLAGTCVGCGSSVASVGPLGNGADSGTTTSCLPADANSPVVFVSFLINQSSKPVVIDSLKLTGASGIDVVAVKVVKPSGSSNGASGAGYPITAKSKAAETFKGAQLLDLPATVPPDENMTYTYTALFAVKASTNGSGATGYEVRYHQGGKKYRFAIQDGFILHFPATIPCS
jgi:hypothetical protein